MEDNYNIRFCKGFFLFFILLMAVSSEIYSKELYNKNIFILIGNELKCGSHDIMHGYNADLDSDENKIDVIREGGQLYNCVEYFYHLMISTFTESYKINTDKDVYFINSLNKSGNIQGLQDKLEKLHSSLDDELYGNNNLRVNSKVDFSGVIWLEGDVAINAVSNGTITSAEYKNYLIDVISKFKLKLTGVPFYIVLPGNGNNVLSNATAQIRKVLYEIATEQDEVYVIYTETDVFRLKGWIDNDNVYTYDAIRDISSQLARRILNLETDKENKDICGLQECMIWSKASEVNNDQAYVLFRKKFTLNRLGEMRLRIFADSRYLLWINGCYVMRGPVRFNPKEPIYDELNVNEYLKEGDNCIVVLVHTYGDNTNGRIIKHEPGLALDIKDSNAFILRTDTTWKCSSYNRYLPSKQSWNSIPDKIDAKMDDEDWLLVDYDDSKWGYAQKIDGSQWGRICHTDVPLCIEKKLNKLIVLPGKHEISFPYRISRGTNLIIDLGKMSMSYLNMDVSCDKEDTLLVKYALRYKDGKIKEMFGEGNMFMTKKGKQHFMTTDQWCCRYVVFTPKNSDVVIDKLSFIERCFPYERKGSFISNDSILNDLWDMGVRTIEATADDAFGSDARERNEWIQDAHKASFYPASVALASQDANGKTDIFLLKRMLRHAALSQHPDGMFSATFPTDRGASDCHYIIEDYACQWVEALHHYYFITNDSDFVKNHIRVLDNLLGWFKARITKNGLVFAREYCSFDNPISYVYCEGATINAFVYTAFSCASELMSKVGRLDLAIEYKEIADRIKLYYNKHLWNNKERAYSSGIIDNELLFPSVHSQLMALYSGIVDDDRKDDVYSWLLENYKNVGSFSICNNNRYKELLKRHSGINMPIMFYWLIKVLYDMDSDYIDLEILNEIRRRWSYMVKLQKDAGTLSESFVDSKGKGSHESCHNYGAVPVYYLSSYVLGVRMEKNKLVVEPRLGDLKYASGNVITPLGIVNVTWKIEKDRLLFSVKLPHKTTAELRLPFVNKVESLTINDRILSSEHINNYFKIEGRWLKKNITENLHGSLKFCK